MICKKPYYIDPSGKTVSGKSFATYEERLAATPFGCGQCLHCRINRARIIKNRILLEATCHPKNAVATLTYDEETVSEKKELVPADLTGFVKRLRNYVIPEKIRYYGVGEYGAESLRPHYHVVLFNFDPARKDLVDKAWQEKGFTSIDEVDSASADYVSGYVIKGCTDTDPRNIGLHPEFMRCSTGKKAPGGLGAVAVQRYGKKIVDAKYLDKEDFTKIKYNGKKMPLGRYLQAVLDEQRGRPEERRLDRLWKYWNEIQKDDMFEGVYSDNVQDSTLQLRKIQKKRYEIYNKKRRL